MLVFIDSIDSFVEADDVHFFIAEPLRVSQPIEAQAAN
jgi:hypothetical protein